MAETAKELVDRILRDHEGYTGDGKGGDGALPVGDRSTAVRPIIKRDLREALIAPLQDTWDARDRAEQAADAAEADRIQTGLDRIATGEDRVATGQDRVQTGLDAQAAAADRVATGQDAQATAADRVQTGLDRTAAQTARTDAQTAQGLAEDARDAAEGAFRDFDKRYLGPHATPPTHDLNGDPVVAGALYFDTGINALRAYDGAAWITVSTAGALLAAANLSDVDDVPTARTNLGLGTAAVVDHGTAPGEVPLNSDLGTMATETATDYVPKAGSSGLGGFTAVGHNLGSLSGTVTPSTANGNFQYGTKGENFTLAAPADGYYSLQIGVTNTSASGSLTATGFNKVNGEFRSELDARHLLLINVSGTTKVLTIMEAS